MPLALPSPPSSERSRASQESVRALARSTPSELRR